MMSRVLCSRDIDNQREVATTVICGLLAMMPLSDKAPYRFLTPQEQYQALDEELDNARLWLPPQLACLINIYVPMVDRDCLVAWLMERDNCDAANFKRVNKRHRMVTHGRN